MRIKLTNIYVDDLDKALRFYTQVAGLVKKTDVSQGGYRWLTVASPEEPDGTELASGGSRGGGRAPAVRSARSNERATHLLDLYSGITAPHVIIDHADCLDKGVDRRRSDEPPTSLAKVLAHRF